MENLVEHKQMGSNGFVSRNPRFLSTVAGYKSPSKRNTCPPSEKHLERKNEELPCYQQVCVIKRNQRQPAQQSGPSHAASSCSAT